MGGGERVNGATGQVTHRRGPAAACVARLVLFADSYKRCLTCGEWVEGYFDLPEGSGAPVLVPCGHASYRDVCASWSPVDGCGCEDYNAAHPDDPIVHRTAIAYFLNGAPLR